MIFKGGEKIGYVEQEGGGESGFTLAEILAILGIVGLLMTLIITYSRTGERQIILFRDEAKVVSAIVRAKTLSVYTYGQSGVPCGYGIHFQAPDTYLIFKDLATHPDCSDADHAYSGTVGLNCTDPTNSGELVQCFSLDPALKFTSFSNGFNGSKCPTSCLDVLFIPPNPDVLIKGPLPPGTYEADIILSLLDNSKSVVIKTTTSGQISTQ